MRWDIAHHGNIYAGSYRNHKRAKTSGYIGSNPQHETGLIAADEVPVLTTSSAELARQQLSALNGCSWLPVNWANEKGGLHTVADSATLSRPLYAIWLQNSDKYSLICDLLKTDVLDEQ